MANKADIASIEIQGRKGKGANSKPVTYDWKPGLKSIKEVK